MLATFPYQATVSTVIHDPDVGQCVRANWGECAPKWTIFRTQRAIFHNEFFSAKRNAGNKSARVATLPSARLMRIKVSDIAVRNYHQ
jgi:hypothetical protein